MSAGAAVLSPTFHGHVATTNDALILFEACLSGQLSHVPRRPHDRERNTLIRSGSVFIYEENASGIKRWTDGVTWSPSRILGNFLVYRELDKPFPPGEKKRAMKKNTRRPTRPGDPYSRPEGSYSPTTPQATTFTNPTTPTDAERQLIGSLIDSYGFKPNGLVKKTMSVTVQGVTHHLVSYYNMEEVISRHLPTPSESPALRGIRPRQELTTKQSFRAPLEEMDDTLEGARENNQGMYGYRPVGPQGYYGGSNPYHSTGAYSQTPQQQGIPSGYSVGTPGMAGHFVPQIGAPQITQREGEYGGYGQSPYNRNYDSLHTTAHSKSIPPTPTSAISPGFPDRPPPQSHAPNMYQPSEMHPRALTAPSQVDSRAPMNYNRNSYSMPNIPDPSRPMQPAPMVKYEDRRDQQHAPGPLYPNDRQPYYGNQSPYPSGPPVSGWQAAGQAGQAPI